MQSNSTAIKNCTYKGIYIHERRTVGRQFSGSFLLEGQQSNSTFKYFDLDKII